MLQHIRSPGCALLCTAGMSFSRPMSNIRVPSTCTCRMSCNWGMRQIHRTRPVAAASGSFSRSLSFLLQTLLAKLMQLRGLPTNLLPLSFFHFHEPHSPARLVC
jgi:hypothetical protein